ncbi:MAG: PKD domain-containing protein [Saprospiraceae bacterium]|nr:PKD domain-containing protein [Saprospiraceae bacterium]
MRSIYSARYFLIPGILVSCLASCLQKQEGSLVTPPEMNRFTTTIVTQPGDFDEPMAFTFLNAGQMVIVERKGGVKLYDTQSREVSKISTIPVNTKYTNADGESREAEEGLMGVIADPEFARNHWIYMFYADPDSAKHVLARWELKGDTLVEASKKIVLEFPTQRELCCHTGGGMVFDNDGNLYLTTGNNTANPPTGISNLDERPGRKHHDDQRTGGNTNDLRGKILRIHPEADGSYTIPEGNLFEEKSEKTRPEIYTMGHRNPWRVSIDSKTGYIYWGEVGPDASKDSTIGPRGYDEFNQARQAGFFGWPYFVGDNKAYADYDFATGKVGEKFDTNNVINDSPNNTGLQELPAPQKAFIWYPYTNSEEFPLVGSSGRSATGGPVFRLADFPESERRFPAYYEGKWLIVEFMRGWIMSVSMDENGDYLGMEPFLPEEDFQSAIDMKFSPQGDLYVLEYGSAWFRGNPNAQLKRIEYNGGNRTPIVRARAEKWAGAAPFHLQLYSDGTIDYDGDELEFSWTIKSDNGFQKQIPEPNPSLILDQVGSYQVTLIVNDVHGSQNSQAFEILVGNEPPDVDITLLSGNQTFFFPDEEINYKVMVNDDEDGSLVDGDIDKNAVAINFDYAPEGFDPVEIAQNHRSTDEWVTFSKGAALISENDCRSCHLKEQQSVGPSYLAIAEKYRNSPAEHAKIANKIITGGTGIWGEHAMSAHPQISAEEAEMMVNYIISLADPSKSKATLPMDGSFLTSVPTGDNGKGGYLLRVAYEDRGSGTIKPLSSEKIIALRNPGINPESYDWEKGAQLLTTPRKSFNVVGDGAYLGFKGIDLTQIGSIEFVVLASPRVDAAGGIIEIRIDEPDGNLIGSSNQIVQKDADRRAIMRKLRADNAKAGNPDAPIDFDLVQRLSSTVMDVQLRPTRGIHDIYFIFSSPGAQEGQILMEIQGIEFKRAKEVL